MWKMYATGYRLPCNYGLSVLVSGQFIGKAIHVFEPSIRQLIVRKNSNNSSKNITSITTVAVAVAATASVASSATASSATATATTYH